MSWKKSKEKKKQKTLTLKKNHTDKHTAEETAQLSDTYLSVNSLEHKVKWIYKINKVIKYW